MLSMFDLAGENNNFFFMIWNRNVESLLRAPNLEFTKWAAVEVSQIDSIPANMETFVLEKGLYAVFHHKGSDSSIFNYIFSEWISKSKYNIDNRPHFELLGEKYKNNDLNSEEEIWIPIKPKHGI